MTSPSTLSLMPALFLGVLATAGGLAAQATHRPFLELTASST